MAPRKFDRYFTGLSTSTVLLAIASLCADLSTELLYPVLPIFLTQVLHAGGSIVGLIEGTAEATQNIVQGLSGWLADRLRSRKPVALVGYAIAAAAKPLIGLAAAWPGVLGARFLDRLGTGTRSAPRDALIAGSADEGHRGKAFGLEGFGDNFGAFLGPCAAVLLLGAFHVEIRTIFYLAAIPGVLAAVMIAFVRERHVDAGASATLDADAGHLPPAYWKYLAAIAVFSIGNSSNSFLILQTKASGASLTATILIYAAFNLVAALISYPAGSLSDRFGRVHLLVSSLVVFLVTYVGFALTQNVAVLGVLFGFYGLYQGVFRSVGKALATDLVPPSLRATGVGWYSATVGLAGLVASVAAGLMWDRIGHAVVFLYGGATAVAGVVALLNVQRAFVPATRTSTPDRI